MTHSDSPDPGSETSPSEDESGTRLEQETSRRGFIALWTLFAGGVGFGFSEFGQSNALATHGNRNQFGNSILNVAQDGEAQVRAVHVSPFLPELDVFVDDDSVTENL